MNQENRTLVTKKKQPESHDVEYIIRILPMRVRCCCLAILAQANRKIFSTLSLRLSVCLSISLCVSVHFSTMSRRQPNIIITGTPGVGKTSHCDVLAANTGLKHLSINQIVKDRGCHDGWDKEYKSWIVDEDKVGQTIHC